VAGIGAQPARHLEAVGCDHVKVEHEAVGVVMRAPIETFQRRAEAVCGRVGEPLDDVAQREQRRCAIVDDATLWTNRGISVHLSLPFAVYMVRSKRRKSACGRFSQPRQEIGRMPAVSSKTFLHGCCGRVLHASARHDDPEHAVPVVVPKRWMYHPLAMPPCWRVYAVSLAVFIPISGWMADRFGTRRVFALGDRLFTFGSVYAVFCSNIHLLVACRVIQGCGGAMMVPVGRLTLVRTFANPNLSGDELRCDSIADRPDVGPVAGGLIVAYLSWRYIFFLNLPIGIAGLIFVFCICPTYREKKTRPLDIVGLIMSARVSPALLRLRSVRRSHVGDDGHPLALGAVDPVDRRLLSLFGTRDIPVARFDALSHTHVQCAVSGGFSRGWAWAAYPFVAAVVSGRTRLHAGAIGLLIMPQSIASLVTKFVLPRS